jgi:hypothetical protein
MSTRTRPQQRSSGQRRFGRPGASAQGRRTTSARPRPVTVSRRRSSQRSGKGGQGLQALTGLLAGRAGKKATSRGAGKGAKAGAGVAMLTAAAGLAFKNRDKLTSMLKRDGGSPETDTSAPPAGTTGSVVHPVPPASSMDAAPPASAHDPLADPAGAPSPLDPGGPPPADDRAPEDRR